MKNENKCCENCAYKQDSVYDDVKKMCLLYDAVTEDANCCDFWRE